MLENLDLYFADDLMSVPVKYGDLETRAILNADDQSFEGGLIQSEVTTILVKVASFPILPVAGDIINVDGEDYEVTVPLARVDDGKIGRIGIGKP